MPTFNYRTRGRGCQNRILQFKKSLFLSDMKFFLLTVFIFLSLFVIGQPIQNKIDHLLKQENLSGAVYSVVNNGHITCYSSGLKNMETREPMLKDAKIHVGSITKTLLAMGVLRLATEDRLNLDDPIKKYLKDLPMNNPWESSHPVTIKHLLNHTAGLSDIRLWHFFSTEVSPQTPLKESYRRNPHVLDIHVLPGTLFSYSNMGYTLLGMLIESIVREPYEHYLDKNLLQPIGLHNSTFRFISQNEDKELAMGHFENGRLALAMPTYVRPAGQFTTTAQDMGTFLQFILNEGRLDGKEFIRSEFIKQFGRPEQTIAAKNGLKLGYAFGALSRDRHAVVGIVHSGNTIGFRAMYYIFPKEKKAFFIAHNMDSETANYEVFNQALIDNLHIHPMRTSFPSKKETAHALWDLDRNGYYVPVITKIFPMELLDIISSYTKVENHKSAISIKPFLKKETLITAEDGLLYIAQNKTEASHLFYKDEHGESYLTTGIMTLKKVNGWKIILPALSITLGVLAAPTLLLLFIFNIYGKKCNYFKSAEAPSSIALLLFVFSGLIVFSNDITQIGDKSFSTILLYCATILFPVGNFTSIIHYGLNLKKSAKRFDFWLVVLIAQCLVTLWCYHVIPFATWE
ncbi:class A beta-lactamase-related serine hydrolase [Sphingobacterium puteale]|uniref:Class A beta-lactamase-related serine hydrolase n=1 Tax=Sphingobacterium puteale TaxID=2420510 RepID=A0A420VW09_9SPHI|nr:serine hydrolase domain-containing protein [Sphingobacterium puteale]RKO70553.1 class A beta-lactamase-related serine hydrolase [Sphingobacterium puteale]